MVTDVARTLRAAVKNAIVDRIPGVLRRGSATANRVALTFDDGPDELTPSYLDVLDRLGVPATFFACGERAAGNPALVREYVRRGHQLANHGYDHTRFTRLDRRALLDQLARTERAIGGHATGRAWVRPPHGSIDVSSLIAMRAAGYVVALWSVDPRDYEHRDPKQIAAACATARAGDVILLHEGQRWTLDAIPQIVADLMAAGRQLVTMRDLFAR